MTSACVVFLALLVMLTLYSPAENGYSIFVRNLPMYANIEFVEEEFKKFGAVKQGGLQVIHHKVGIFWFLVLSMIFILTILSASLQFVDGFCFGFVEYESQQSMQAAIEVSFLFSTYNHCLCGTSLFPFSPPCAIELWKFSSSIIMASFSLS
jgi:RNA recognition motif-containing protein